jgi:aspartyl-tRNA(Asn)/glutamyl-tRNA(Gln) amidotransferase subunit C
MEITRQEVEHVAKLARLALRPEEVEAMTGHLAHILSYMEMLNRVDTRDCPPTSHVIPMVNVMRDDRERESLDREKVLKNAPDRTEEFFRVPKVIE